MEFKTTERWSRRRAAALVRPLLSSPRLVGLFVQIGLLACTRPGAVATVEIVVARLQRPKTVKATMRRKTGEKATG